MGFAWKRISMKFFFDQKISYYAPAQINDRSIRNQKTCMDDRGFGKIINESCMQATY